MFVTKKSLSRRTVLKGLGAAVGLPFLESMIPAFTPLAKAAAAPPRRFGVVYFPNGAIMQQFTPATAGDGFEFTPILKPLRTVQRLSDRCDESHALPSGQPGWRSRGQRRRISDRRVAEANRSRRCSRQHHDRSDRCQADRPGYAAAVARTGDRRFHRLCRRLLAGIQLRLHEHDLMAHADHSAADGNESARGIRTDFRRSGQRRTSGWSAFNSSAAFSIRFRKKPRVSSAAWARGTAHG